MVPQLVEMPHTNLTKVAGMVFVEENAMVVHTSSVTPTTWMLPVLADTPVACAHMPSLLPVLFQSGRHLARPVLPLLRLRLFVLPPYRRATNFGLCYAANIFIQ